MDTRRMFLRRSALLAAASTMPGCSSLGKNHPKCSLRTNDPRTALVAWYSQSGNTARYGRLVSAVLEKEGIAVTSGDYRDISIRAEGYDLVIIGSPVYYYTVPVNFEKWLHGIPSIKGSAVGAFVSFGGPEGNQHNTLCAILDILVEKGGCPVAMRSFMNMSSFPLPEWDGPGQKEHGHLPDENTYREVAGFARDAITSVRQGKLLAYESKLTSRQCLTALPLVGMSKMFFRNHHVDRSVCINCRLCETKCPAAAIKPAEGTVKRSDCILCFGCLNNCPAGAVKMKYMGKELYGFPEFLKRNNIVIREPAEIIS